MKKLMISFFSLLLIMLLPGTVFPGENTCGNAVPGSTYADGLSVSGITANGAVFSYLAGGTQITEHGVVFGKSAQPALGSSTRAALYLGAAKDVASTKTFFKLNVSRLEPATKYYARAYVKNSSGSVNYSNEVSFTTPKLK